MVNHKSGILLQSSLLGGREGGSPNMYAHVSKCKNDIK
jgi:hypothetical protein